MLKLRENCHRSGVFCWQARLWWTMWASCGLCLICWCRVCFSQRRTLMIGLTSIRTRRTQSWPMSKSCLWFSVCTEWWSRLWCAEPKRIWRQSCQTRSRLMLALSSLLCNLSFTKSYCGNTLLMAKVTRKLRSKTYLCSSGKLVCTLTFLMGSKRVAKRSLAST